MKIKNLISFQNKKYLKKIQPNQKKYLFKKLKKNNIFLNFIEIYMKKAIKSTNQIKNIISLG